MTQQLSTAFSFVAGMFYTLRRIDSLFEANIYRFILVI